MATKKTKSNLKSDNDWLGGWSKTIKKMGEERREQSKETKRRNVIRAEAISNLPLRDIFTEEAAGTDGVVEILEELIKDAPLDGISDKPDPFTVALVRAAAFWHKRIVNEHQSKRRNFTKIV